MIEYELLALSDLLDSDDYDKNIIAGHFQAFKCKRDTDLEMFLQDKAIEYDEKGFGKTFLFLDSNKLKQEEKPEFCIMAYFTIAMAALDMTDKKKKKKRKIFGEHPGRDTVKSMPTFLIGQLGRCDKYSHDDLAGNQILDECYSVISRAARIIGGKVLLLECREHMYGKFYEDQNFRKLNDSLNESKLYTLYKRIDFSEYWKEEPS